MLGLILLVGLLLRLTYLASIQDEPDYNLPAMDAAFKDYWARSILHGDQVRAPGRLDPQLSTTPYVRPPAYPFWLAFVYMVTNFNYTAVRLIQFLFGLANCALLYMLGRRLFGPPVGLIAAGLMATYWAFVFFEAEINAPVFIVFLLLTLFNVASSWLDGFTFKKAFWPGVLYGLLVLIRPETLLFLPVLLAWAWWKTAGTQGGRRVARSLCIFVVGLALAIAPVTLRNYVKSGEFVLICTIGGLNLYAGNGPDADGSFPTMDYDRIFGVAQDLQHENFPVLVEALERKTGQKGLGHADLQAFFVREALAYMAENPGRTLALMGKKALLYWGPAEVTSNKAPAIEKAHSPILRFLPGFPFVLGTALAGMLMYAQNRRGPSGEGMPTRSRLHGWIRKQWWGWIITRLTGAARSAGDATVSQRARDVVPLLLAFVLVSFSTHLLFFVVARFRVPIIPILLLFAAYAIYQLYVLTRSQLKRSGDGLGGHGRRAHRPVLHQLRRVPA